MKYVQSHPLKVASGGIPVVTAPIILYTDDFSGNRSKKWNKFDGWCMTMAGIPKIEANKFHNIHFISCSNNVSAMEMADPLVADLLLLENGVKMYDAYLGKEVYVLAPVLCVLCDNVRASELLHHLGSKAVRLCRFCMVSINIIHFSTVLILLCFQKTDSSNTTAIGCKRTKELAIMQKVIIASQSTKKACLSKRREFGLTEDENPFFRLSSVDLFRLNIL